MWKIPRMKEEQKAQQMSVQQRATYNLAHGLLLGQETSLSVTSSSNHHKISTRWWIKCCQGPVEALLTVILKQRLWGRTHFSLNIRLFLSFFFFWLCYLTCRTLVPQPGIKPMAPAVEAQSLNHCQGNPPGLFLTKPYLPQTHWCC